MMSDGKTSCSDNFRFGVISEQTGLAINVDGIIGLGPQNLTDNSSFVGKIAYRGAQTENPNVQIDLKNNMLHFGAVQEKNLFNKTQNPLFVTFNSTTEDRWVVKMTDLRYNSNTMN